MAAPPSAVPPIEIALPKQPTLYDDQSQSLCVPTPTVAVAPQAASEAVNATRSAAVTGDGARALLVLPASGDAHGPVLSPAAADGQSPAILSPAAADGPSSAILSPASAGEKHRSLAGFHDQGTTFELSFAA
jgi:hypothetical protein